MSVLPYHMCNDFRTCLSTEYLSFPFFVKTTRHFSFFFFFFSPFYNLAMFVFPLPFSFLFPLHSYLVVTTYNVYVALISSRIYVHVKATGCRWLTGPYSKDKTNQPSIRDVVDDNGGYGLCTKAGIPVASGCWLVETEQEIECCYFLVGVPRCVNPSNRLNV